MTQKLLFSITVLSCFVCTAESEQFAGKVIAVTDGDMISVMRDGVSVRIRLHGMDCPEDGQAFGENAKFATLKLCQSKTVTVQVRERDKQGRPLAVVTLPDGECLNHELVRQGFAWWDRKLAPEDVKLEQLEAAAKKAGVGLWSASDPVPPWEFRKNPTRRAPVPVPVPPKPVPVAAPVIVEREPEVYAPAAQPPTVVLPEVSSITPVPQPSPKASIASQSPAAADVVYITDTGGKYHRGNCRHLSKSKISVSLQDAIAQGYQPCGVCKP